MQIVRHQSHTARMARRYGWITLILMVAVLVLWFVNRIAASVPAVFLGLFALLTLKEILPDAERWMVGHLGEKQVLQTLGELPDNYVAVTNFVVPGTRQGDTDLLLIGPLGVVVIEIKTYSGVVVYEQGRWWKRQPNGWKTRLPKSPSAQVKNNRKAIIAYLQQARTGQTERKSPYVPVEALLVFVDTDDLETNDLSITALRLPALTDYIKSRPSVLTPPQSADVAALFRPL